MASGKPDSEDEMSEPVDRRKGYCCSVCASIHQDPDFERRRRAAPASTPAKSDDPRIVGNAEYYPEVATPDSTSKITLDELRTSTSAVATPDTPAGETQMRYKDADPTPELLSDPVWNAIWEVIKSWDVNVPDAYSGYMEANGNHATMIFQAIRAVPSPAETKEEK